MRETPFAGNYPTLPPAIRDGPLAKTLELVRKQLRALCDSTYIADKAFEGYQPLSGNLTDISDLTTSLLGYAVLEATDAAALAVLAGAVAVPWTPSLTAGTTPPTGVTYGVGGQVGIYFKLGPLIIVPTCRVTLTSKGAAGVGNVRLNLPFTANASSLAISSPVRYAGVTLPSAGVGAFFQIASGQSYANLNTQTNTDSTINVAWADITDTFDCSCSFFYRT